MWLEDGLKKIEQLDFLTKGTGRTLSQAALQFIWHEPTIASALPNVYDEKQLEEFCAAADVAPLTEAEYVKVQALYEANFGLEKAGVC
jgi:aryl-alcohol dehydrogenase-like predicted oxidoreductase